MVCANRSGSQVRQFIKSWKNLFEDAYLKEDLHFAECVLEDKSPSVTGADGLMAVKIVQAGNLSIAEKRIVRLED